MTKRGPLSKAEKFYIDNHLNVDIDEICKDLDRAKLTVEKYIRYLPKEKKQTAAKKQPLLSQQFARNEKGGATVMTPNASIMADDKRADFSSKKNNRDCITKVRQDG